MGGGGGERHTGEQICPSLEAESIGIAVGPYGGGAEVEMIPYLLAFN